MNVFLIDEQNIWQPKSREFFSASKVPINRREISEGFRRSLEHLLNEVIVSRRRVAVDHFRQEAR